MVSPAPPSKSTLSGTTIVALPFLLTMMMLLFLPKGISYSFKASFYHF